jgi:hypothetical protein
VSSWIADARWRPGAEALDEGDGRPTAAALTTVSAV